MIQGLLALFALVLLGLAWKAPRGAAVALTSGRACPSGHGPLERLPRGTADQQSYEVFACLQCDFAETTVHGARSPLAYCPSCRQRALHIELSRPAHTVNVAETCQICGYRGETAFVLPDAPGDDSAPDDDDAIGNVIPFRAGRRDR